MDDLIPMSQQDVDVLIGIPSTLYSIPYTLYLIPFTLCLLTLFLSFFLINLRVLSELGVY
jgi:hypothetical protein